jgi:hypothetical protein
VSEANLAGSFPSAARLLGRLASVTISPKQVQLITERVGNAFQARRAEATEAFLRSPKAQAPLRSKGSRSKGPALLVIGIDGGRVQTRQDDPKDKWKEDKVGVVWEATPSPEVPNQDYAGPTPVGRSITATLAPWDTLGDHLSALADRKGYARALQKICLSDGAGSIASQRERCFPDAAFVLDYTHAVEHLHQTAQAAFGSSDPAKVWVERQEQRLWKGHLDPLIADIARLSRRAGPPPPKAPDSDPRRILATNLHYFQTNGAGMDYPTFRQRGWPIGSGVVESTIKQIGKRLKGSEKHWTLPGAEATLQVITALLSDDGLWDAFWKHCPLAA